MICNDCQGICVEYDPESVYVCDAKLEEECGKGHAVFAVHAFNDEGCTVQLRLCTVHAQETLRGLRVALTAKLSASIKPGRSMTRCLLGLPPEGPNHDQG